MNFSQALILAKLGREIGLPDKPELILYTDEHKEILYSKLTKEGLSPSIMWPVDIMRDDWEVVDERPKDQQPA